MAAFPPLRHVDVIPTQHEGQPVIVLHDPAGYVEAQVALSPPAFFVAASLDGEKDCRAIQEAFAGQYDGLQIEEDQIQTIVAFLDEQGFLLNDRFLALCEETDEAFRGLGSRPARLAGNGYPTDVDELRDFLGAFFAGEKGPGPLPDRPGTGAPQRCLVVPHIDFQRGGHCYAHGYHSLYAHGKPDTVFVFGVVHAGAPVPFVLTGKHFETPFGTVPTNQRMVSELARACAWDPWAWEPLHRTEHSLEFQALMLAYLYGPDVQIVPILCSSFSEDRFFDDPESAEGVQAFLRACRGLASDPANRVAVIAGADLAHVGRRFGDDIEIDATVLGHVEHRDREDLAHVLAGDPEAFFKSVMRDGNERKVCGLTCIYSALKTVEGTTGAAELLDYGYGPDPAGGIVSFAGISLS
jgi:AmmeMemoRadiSam system protein B